MAGLASYLLLRFNLHLMFLCYMNPTDSLRIKALFFFTSCLHLNFNRCACLCLFFFLLLQAVYYLFMKSLFLQFWYTILCHIYCSHWYVIYVEAHQITPIREFISGTNFIWDSFSINYWLLKFIWRGTNYSLTVDLLSNFFKYGQLSFSSAEALHCTARYFDRTRLCMINCCHATFCSL